jgi:hypothetical protein
LRLIDRGYQSTLGLIVIKKKKKSPSSRHETANTPGRCRLSKQRRVVRWGLFPDDRLRVEKGTTRAEDAQGTPSKSLTSPSILVFEEQPPLRTTSPSK